MSRPWTREKVGDCTCGTELYAIPNEKGGGWFALCFMHTGEAGFGFPLPAERPDHYKIQWNDDGTAEIVEEPTE